MIPSLEVLEDRAIPAAWGTSPITWSLDANLADGWGQRTYVEVRAATERAFALWEQAAPALDFLEVQGSSADVDIHLEPIDGQGYSTYWGYAMYPPDGKIILDAADSLTPAQLDWIVLHETGHSLDLRHTGNVRDVMYRFYRGQTALTAADQQAILALYANPVASSPLPVTPGTPAAPSDPETSQDPYQAYLSQYYAWLDEYYRIQAAQYAAYLQSFYGSSHETAYDFAYSWQWSITIIWW